MIRVRFRNSTDTPCYVQVDPWAGLYRLQKGESVEIEGECDTACPSAEFDELGETKIVTLPDCTDYFVIHDGQRLHWTEFPTNLTE